MINGHLINHFFIIELFNDLNGKKPFSIIKVHVHQSEASFSVLFRLRQLYQDMAYELIIGLSESKHGTNGTK